MPSGRASAGKPSDRTLAGSLLLAHPTMRDPNFRRAVVLLSSHDAEGSLGVVINRPTGQVLAELDAEFLGGPIARVPVFTGGPVDPQRLILAAWQILPEENSFRLFFGVDPGRLARLQDDFERLEARAFCGYSGWSGGQLEGELERDDWIVHPMNPDLMQRLEGAALWRALVGSISFDLRLLAEAPDEPENN